MNHLYSSDTEIESLICEHTLSLDVVVFRRLILRGDGSFSFRSVMSRTSSKSRLSRILFSSMLNSLRCTVAEYLLLLKQSVMVGA